MNRQLLNLASSFALTTMIAISLIQPAAADFTVIHHNISGVPGYEVPGLSPTGFQFSTSGSNNLNGVYTFDGGKWALIGRAQLATAQDDVLIIDGALTAQEGTSAPFASGETFGPIPGSVAFAINDAGVFALRNNTNGPTAADEYIVKNVAGVYSVIAKEGQPTGFIANANWGGILTDVQLTADGRVGFRSSNLTGSGITMGVTDQIVVLGSQLIAQRGVTVPGNQAGGGSATLINIDGFSASLDGSSTILQASLAGGGNSSYSAVVDGDIVIQAGQAFGGFFSPVNAVQSVNMDPAGNWFVTGVNENNQNWLVRNGTLLGAEGQPVAGGPSVWMEAFAGSNNVFNFTAGNGVGDWLLGGWDNSGAGGTSNALLMLNGDIIARQGDPVDLNGNGLFDDGFYFGRNFNKGALADDGTIYFTAQLQNATGADAGYAFFTRPGSAVPEPVSAVLVLLGSIALAGTRRRHS